MHVDGFKNGDIFILEMIGLMRSGIGVAPPGRYRQPQRGHQADDEQRKSRDPAHGTIVVPGDHECQIRLVRSTRETGL